MILQKNLTPYSVCLSVMGVYMLFLIPGCASTPTWPMENIGTAQFSGHVPDLGNLLIVPTSDTRSACRKAAAACRAFAENLAHAININSQASAYLTVNYESMSVSYENEKMVENEIDRVKAQYLLVWEIGIIDDRKAFSFGPDAISISTLKIINITSNATDVQLLKPYGLINPNSEDFVQVARELGSRLGRYLASHL